MGVVKDLTGKSFGSLLVLGQSGRDNSGKIMWEVECSCGFKGDKRGADLLKGSIVSCGKHKAKPVEHGHSVRGKASKEYMIWQTMRQRCKNPKSRNYSNYGARGIKVSKEWDDFSVFLADMGTKPAGFSIERIDNNGNYCKDNCKWAPRSEQARNKRNVPIYMYKGRSMTLPEVARLEGINRRTLSYRIQKGSSIEDAAKELKEKLYV